MKQKSILRPILFYVLAVLLNLTLNRLAAKLGIPLFIDNVGTLSAAALGGYLPGIIVGYLTNIVNVSADPANAYYAMISTLIAASGAYLADKGFFKSFWKSVLTVPVFALLGGALGSVVTYFLYGFGIGEGISAPFARALLDNGTLTVFQAQMISDVAIDLVDKLITVILVYLVLRLIPEKIKPSLRLTGWRQVPLTGEQRIKVNDISTEAASLRTKIVVIICGIMIFIAVVTTAISYILFYNFTMGLYEPVYDEATGELMYVASSLGAHELTMSGVSYITKVASLFVGFFILILALCVWLADYNIIYPLSSMTFITRRFAFGSDHDLEDSVKRLNDLHIVTKDEIESLYEAVSKTLGDTVGYLEDVENKGNEIARMQNGLIYVLADLVESRDKNTGDHVRKTAAYVRLMLRKMKEKGVYSDQVTDEYAADVSNSAPLHDVGKIKVSDVILNKPGRLDDEEFAIMKTHTTAGSHIIDEAMELVSDSTYLREARNLATYHHEKWDGSGYPEGLKGEEIPLSARIMAIADVFDALVSKRSYKKAFEIDDALNIIKEGAGTHFDPVLVEVFLDSEDEVRLIAKEHSEKMEAGEQISFSD